MSKKYVPSGYQIINLDLSDKTSGTPFTPETEDEKILHDILLSGKITKPILLKAKTTDYDYLGFPVFSTINGLYMRDSSTELMIFIADDVKITYIENEF